MKRALTAQELGWLRQGLATLETPDPTPYLHQLDGLQVVGRCPCGDKTCNTVQFRQIDPQTQRLLVHSGTNDGRELIIFVDEQERLVELEII